MKTLKYEPLMIQLKAVIQEPKWSITRKPPGKSELTSVNVNIPTHGAEFVVLLLKIRELEAVLKLEVTPGGNK